jgi:heavy metal sensor kinase
MSLSLKARFTITFSFLFAILIFPFLGAVTYFLVVALESDLQIQTIHDYEQIMIVFDEQPSWELALEELYEEEADEFNIHIRILDKGLSTVFLSAGLKDVSYSIDDLKLKNGGDAAMWSEGQAGGIPHMVLTEMFYPKDKEPHYCQIWKSEENINKIERKFIVINLIGLPFIIFISVLLGMFFSKRALIPVELIRQKTEEIHSDDLSSRLPYPPHKDELYWLTDTFNRLLDRIEKAFDGMRRFTADASHELRIPLTNLKGTIDVALQRKRTVEEYEAVLKDAQEEVDRLADLVRSLLVLARIDAKKFSIEKSQVNLSQFLNQVFKYAQTLNKDNEMRLQLEEIPSIDVFIDSEKLTQLLLILLDNAVKYNRAGGSVSLSAEKNKDGVTIIVADTGDGIPNEEQEKIFERFYRIEKSRSRDKGGTGLGLSIARSIAVAHQGSLTVQSTPGKGSIFRLFIPLGQTPY